MIPRAWILGAGAALCVAVGLWGYARGYEAAEGRMALEAARDRAAMVQAAELASRKEAERLVAEQAVAVLVQELEDAAYAEAVSATDCLPLSRVLRLDQR